MKGFVHHLSTGGRKGGREGGREGGRGEQAGRQAGRQVKVGGLEGGCGWVGNMLKQPCLPPGVRKLGSFATEE